MIPADPAGRVLAREAGRPTRPVPVPQRWVRVRVPRPSECLS
jgi:hypothetical protein